MNNLAACVTITALCAGTALAQDTVTFTKKRPEAGDVRAMSSEMSVRTKVEVRVGDRVLQKVDQEVREAKDSEITILSGSGKDITKLRLEVKKGDYSLKGPGENQRSSPLVGKKLIVTKSDDGYRVIDGDGAPVPMSIQSAAEPEVRPIFNGDFAKFAEILPDRPVKIGETITINGQQALELLGTGDKNMDDAKLELKLERTKKHDGRECAEFSVKMTMNGKPEDGMRMRGEVEGMLLIDIGTTWPCAMTLSGPITIRGRKGYGERQMELDATGKMDLKLTAKYSKSN